MSFCLIFGPNLSLDIYISGKKGRTYRFLVKFHRCVVKHGWVCGGTNLVQECGLASQSSKKIGLPVLKCKFIG
jgi:hypothetical protein